MPNKMLGILRQMPSIMLSILLNAIAYQAVHAIFNRSLTGVRTVPTGRTLSRPGCGAGVKSATSCCWQWFRSEFKRRTEDPVFRRDPALDPFKSIEKSNGYIDASSVNKIHEFQWSSRIPPKIRHCSVKDSEMSLICIHTNYYGIEYTPNLVHKAHMK